MAEKIFVLRRDTVGVILWSAICATLKDTQDIKEFPLNGEGDETWANVVMTVNGVEVPIVKTLENYYKQDEERLEQRARDLIVSKLTQDSPLYQLLNRLEEARWKIEQDLDRLFPDTQFTDR